MPSLPDPPRPAAIALPSVPGVALSLLSILSIPRSFPAPRAVARLLGPRRIGSAWLALATAAGEERRGERDVAERHIVGAADPGGHGGTAFACQCGVANAGTERTAVRR